MRTKKYWLVRIEIRLDHRWTISKLFHRERDLRFDNRFVLIMVMAVFMMVIIVMMVPTKESENEFVRIEIRLDHEWATNEPK